MKLLNECRGRRWWDSSLDSSIDSAELLDVFEVDEYSIRIFSVGKSLCAVPCYGDTLISDTDENFLSRIMSLWMNETTLYGTHGKIVPVMEKKIDIDGIHPVKGTTNPCFIGGKKHFIKFYRLMSDINPEPEIMKKLSEIMCPNVPEVVGWIEYYNEKIHPHTFAISSMYIHGKNGIEFFKEHFSDDYGRVCSLELGKSLRNLHKCMSKVEDCVSISPSDEDRWRKKIFERLEKYADEAAKKTVLNGMGSSAGRTKCRCHQDMHLAQCIKSDRWYFVDFEGEPLRLGEEKREKMPYYLDVASMVTSFYYLQEMNKLPLEDAEKLIDSFLRGYFNTMDEYDRECLRFWLFYRCLYEIEYESRFRKHYSYIPSKNIKKIKKREEGRRPV